MNYLLSEPNKMRMASLPAISMRQLEKSVASKLPKKNVINSDTIETKNLNHKEMNVCSPFYDRMSTHKQNCKCPFHRRKRLPVQPVGRFTDQTYLLQSKARNSHNRREQLLIRTSANGMFSNTSSTLNKKHLDCTFDSSLLSSYTAKPHHFGQNSRAIVDSHNVSYDSFLKDFQLYALQRDGFNSECSSHVIRKGVKEIFTFIKNHLDYSVEKMRTELTQIKKDKQYDEFYLDRFREMKRAYEQGKIDRSPTLEKDSPENQSRRKKKLNAKQLKTSSGEHSRNISLRSMIQELQRGFQIPDIDLNDFLNTPLSAFGATFKEINISIMDGIYDDELLGKIEKSIMKYLRFRSSSRMCPQAMEKLKIINETYEFIRMYKQKKRSTLRDKRSQTSSPQQLSMGNIQSNKASKKASAKNSCDVSDEEPQKKEEENLQRISETDQSQVQVDEVLSLKSLQKKDSREENRNRDRSLSNSGPKTILGSNLNQRKSRKVFPSHATDQDSISESDEVSVVSEKPEPEPQTIKKTDRGLLKKAQLYLYEINMGNTVVKKEDSLFTAKRKVRVIKNLLLKSKDLTESETEELHEYVESIEARCNYRKHTALAQKEGEAAQEDEFSELSLENMGYKLIFYDLTAKIKFENNEDLCIMLNEIPNVGKRAAKFLDQEVSYKKRNWESELFAEKSVFRRSRDYLLMQKDLAEMQIEELQSDSGDEVAPMQRQKTVGSRTLRKTVFFQNRQQNSETANDDDSDPCSFIDEKQVKRIFTYAYHNFPNSFDSYLKNADMSQVDSFLSYREQFSS